MVTVYSHPREKILGVNHLSNLARKGTERTIDVKLKNSKFKLKPRHTLFW